MKLFNENLKIINIGLKSFKNDLEMQGQKVAQVNWTPSQIKNVELLDKLDDILKDEKIKEANKKAVKLILESTPFLVDIDYAKNVVPNLSDKMILHAGPPVTWENMAGPVKGAMIGACIYEGWAKDDKEAIKLIESGEVKFDCCHHHNTVGPMAGIVSPSMPVHVIENTKFGNKAYCTVNEGLGKVLRFGAYEESVINRLKWIENTYMPNLKKALKLSGPIDLRNITAQALHMGDECHNRNKASTSLFFREIAPYIVKVSKTEEELNEIFNFLQKNDHYFLNLSMPACKSSLDVARNVEYSTILTVMARNGFEFGIQISSLGNKWFTGKAEDIKGLYFPGYSEKDACPDLGDSAITETMGIGGFAMAAAPSIVQFVGGKVEDAISYSKSMYSITTDINNNYTIPNLNFKGTSLGIDLLKVIEKEIRPVINTGVAHKDAGVGQIGAGIVHAPMICFEKALEEYIKKYN
ncbi:MAG: DUF1116 domain-containing protein [Helcococcus sp.]|nr:DUF1116 domain-containing protein [Helcococcus sp.]